MSDGPQDAELSAMSRLRDITIGALREYEREGQ